MYIRNVFEVKLQKYNPIKKLLISKISQAGQNSSGKIILLGRGGMIKRFYRLIDFNRFLEYMPAKVLRFEYDPNRNFYIMLVGYYNGFCSYLLMPYLIKINGFIGTNLIGLFNIGSCFNLLFLKVGSFIHTVEFRNLLGGKIARASGTFVQLIRKVSGCCSIRMPSKEERFISLKTKGVLGRLAGDLYKLTRFSKAGQKRNLGFRSKVRGVAKNPIDHPHGGGEGRATSGIPSVSPWGIYTKGIRTTTRYKRINTSYIWGFFRRRTGIVW